MLQDIIHLQYRQYSEKDLANPHELNIVNRHIDEVRAYFSSYDFNAAYSLENIADYCLVTKIEKWDFKSYLTDEYKDIFDNLYQRFNNVKLDKLPSSFVHGDIISSNVMKDNNGKLWIIDFAVSNYLPRIVDLAVTSCNLCLNPDNKDKTIESTKMILDEYQKYNKLTDYELECFPLFYNLANAMGILQVSYLASLGEMSEEDAFWLAESEKGLSFSTPDFWNSIIGNNGYVEMWDNWSKKRSGVPVYDLWLDEYKDLVLSTE